MCRVTTTIITGIQEKTSHHVIEIYILALLKANQLCSLTIQCIRVMRLRVRIQHLLVKELALLDKVSNSLARTRKEKTEVTQHLQVITVTSKAVILLQGRKIPIPTS